MAASVKTVCINPRHLQEAHWRTDHIGACKVNGLAGQAIAMFERLQANNDLKPSTIRRADRTASPGNNDNSFSLRHTHP